MILVPLLVLGLGCGGSKDAMMAPGGLDGIWVPVRQEVAGKSLPQAAFENQKLVLSDTLYTLVAESVDKGMVTYLDGKMDIYGRDGVNTGKHITAIYKFAEGQLTICYNLAGDVYPEGFATGGKQRLFLSVFKREGAAEPAGK